MEIKIPDEIVRRAEANATELRVALAIQLYADNRIDYIDALELAGMPKPYFNKELLSRGLSIQDYPAGSIPQRNAS